MIMMGVLTSDLFIQLTTTLAHLSNMTLNIAEMALGGKISNETLSGRRQWHCLQLTNDQSQPVLAIGPICDVGRDTSDQSGFVRVTPGSDI